MINTLLNVIKLSLVHELCAISVLYNLAKNIKINRLDV